ncbi:homeobox and leucine zipper encoding b [Toxotes jaculatrix]|uniref:homeobox and leucine zipper encoding b n=1 Tax=Toxotes jaculatrix TaxID=941984 RepID=UPI001B3A8245|nr:homeobox and leucine zipper encoding b [Toxotes jaculatrix]
MADGGPPGLRQKTPDACGETSTDTNLAPEAFSMNQNSALCLPLLSEDQKLIWVHSNQINLQMDGAAELEKAFDRFPYLTQEETAALAQHCSLHPDQVKVWFMLQRLRYGISWDYQDIQEVWRKLKLSQGKEELQNLQKEDKRKKKKRGREVKESGGKKAGKVTEEQNTKEGWMMGENGRANEQFERKMKQKQPLKKKEDRKVGKVEGDKGNTRKKQKRMGKRMKQDDDGIVERARRIYCSAKTKTQLEMMKVAFSHCQYPNREVYDRLAALIGIPRYMLVQWFGDMRYYIKKGRPHWMSEKQHRHALVNIKYRQCLNMLAKEQSSEDSRKGSLEEEG